MRLKSSEPSSPERARQYALQLLADRDYTIAQLKQKLRTRHFTDTDSDQAIAGLERENWISDRRFAERFAESAQANGRYFGIRLKLEMVRRGIPELLASEIIDNISRDRDENEVAQQVLSKRFPGFMFDMANDGEKRRVLTFLQRRGFRASVALRAMRADIA